MTKRMHRLIDMALHEHHMTMGQLAERTDIPIDTIRYGDLIDEEMFRILDALQLYRTTLYDLPDEYDLSEVKIYAHTSQPDYFKELAITYNDFQTFRVMDDW